MTDQTSLTSNTRLAIARLEEVRRYLTTFPGSGTPGSKMADAVVALTELMDVRANETTGNRSVTLNGYQLKAALEFVAPDNDADQLDTEVSIQWGNAKTGHSGAGYYCCLTEYPEEGSILLDDKPESSSVETSARDWVICCGSSWYGTNGKFVTDERDAKGFPSASDAQDFAKGMRCPWSVRERSPLKASAPQPQVPDSMCVWRRGCRNPERCLAAGCCQQLEEVSQ